MPAGRGHIIFVNIDVVDVSRRRVAHSLLLRQHRADNGFHDEGSHIKAIS